jgi:hypothetical protein
MRLACALVALVAVAALSSCTKRQNSNQCVTGDQKACPCLGGGDGVQVCQADGTYAACQCVGPSGDDMNVVSADDMTANSGSDDMAASTGGDDMAHAADLAQSVDASSPDGGGCIGGTPDEDGDGRANACDLCPADSDPTPVDTDGDGLPDACDPDPSTKTNALLYFEPFDVDSGHWSGANAITQSYINIDTQTVGTTSATNSSDMLPVNVRVQTIIFPVSEHGNGGGDTGIFIGTNANVNQADGAFCALTWNNASPDTLDLYKVTNGTFSVPATQQLATNLQNTTYRIRLAQHAGTWTCEALQTGQAAVTVTMAQAPVVTAPLFMSFINDNMGSHFHSVVAESIAPRFFPDIQADLDAKGCTITACHGTSGTGAVMVVKANATMQTDIDANYASVMAEVNATTPSQSPLLTKPLAGSAVTHSGTKPFASTSDPTYVRWLSWIQSGAPKQ